MVDDLVKTNDHFYGAADEEFYCSVAGAIGWFGRMFHRRCDRMFQQSTPVTKKPLTTNNFLCAFEAIRSSISAQLIFCFPPTTFPLELPVLTGISALLEYVFVNSFPTELVS